MTPEDIMRQMQGQQQPQRDPAITDAKIDEFINRVMAEKDETLYSMAMALQQDLQQPMVSMAMVGVYPYVLQRIQQRLDNGEV